MLVYRRLVDRLAGWPRRLVAVGCLILAAGSAVAAQPAAGREPVRDVVVAAHDLAAGAVLVSGDVRVAAWPAAIRPPAATERPADVIGRRLADALRAQEPVTTTRLAGGSLTVALRPGLVAAPVELSATSNVTILHAGDVVDLLVADHLPAADSTASVRADVLAEAVRVLAVDAGTDRDSGSTASIVVAVDRTTALRLAASTGRVIMATLRSPP